jgi:outer membrane protein OmpA-like peptidoglycan-associated protein
MRPDYPPRGQYRALPAAPAAAVNPLDAELNKTQEQLKAKTTELDKTHAMLEQLQVKLRHSLQAERALSDKVADITREQQALQARVTELTAELNTTTVTLEQNRQQITNDQQHNLALTSERDRLRNDLASRDKQLATVQTELQAAAAALQQATSETTTSGQQLSEARAQAERLNNELTELKAQLENQKSSLLVAEQTLAAEHDSLRSDLASREAQLATVQTELQAATAALQQATSETTTSGQQLSEARAQAETLTKELTELKTQLADRKSSLLDTEQTLATVTAERNELQADIATCSRNLNQAKDALTDIQSEMDALSRANTAAADAIIAPASGGPDKSEPAASEGYDAGAAKVAAQQIATTDTDEDGISDSIDLCPETKPGIAVESTGCTTGEAINLSGVNFLYNSHELTDRARDILDRVAAIINQQPDLRLEVAGHTDATGDSTYNQWLSLQRAETVMNYLVDQGVNPKHIGAAGYGGLRPIADNTTSEGMQVNRRVELRPLQ